FDRDRQSAADSAQAPVQRKLADKQRVRDLLLIEPAISAQNAQRHRQVETGPFFANVGRRQIDRDLGGRNVVAAVLQRRPHPVPAFADRGVGQPDRVKVVFLHFDARNVHFHFDDVGVNTVNCGTQGLIEHRGHLCAHEGVNAGWEIPATILAPPEPHRCDGHHPVTVMERSVLTGRFRCYARENAAETMNREIVFRASGVSPMPHESSTPKPPDPAPNRLEVEESQLWRWALLLLVLFATAVAALSFEQLKDLPYRLWAIPAGLFVLAILFATYAFGRKREVSELK